MPLPPPDVCRRIRDLHAMMGSPNVHEGSNAHAKLWELMTESGISWNDLTAILAEADNPATDAASSPPPPPPPSVSLLDIVTRLIERHVDMPPGERLIGGLWTMHTWIFDKFNVTPRLAVLSPARDCGKSTLLHLISYLVDEPFLVDDVSAAAARYWVDEHPRTTLLVDEFDNLNLSQNRELRTLFNTGHGRGSGSSRRVQGGTRRFKNFAPLCMGGIGMLPATFAPLATRTIKICLHRAPPAAVLQKLDEHNPDFAIARGLIRPWAQSCKLSLDPPMPSAFYNRVADNYRPLFAIADDLGCGAEAREAALALESRYFNDDPGVVALCDLRTVFNMHGPSFDRISTEEAIEKICEVNERWLEWRGPREDQQPHQLTPIELAHLISRFEIRTKSIWPLNRKVLGVKSSKKGYFRAQFSDVWARYCLPERGTAAHPSKIIRLASGRNGTPDGTPEAED